MASMKPVPMLVDPTKINLLEMNAHYMPEEKFKRLVRNIERDGVLTSVPFVWRVHDDNTHLPLSHPNGEPVLEVLSGNHRVRASIDAKLPSIYVLMVDSYIDPDHRRAIQLSHNELVGEDDPGILQHIYKLIQTPNMKLYSGLDDKRLNLMQPVKVSPLSDAGLRFQQITMLFLPADIDRVEDALNQAQDLLENRLHVYLSSFAAYDNFMDALETVQNGYNVKNIGAALMVILETFERHLVDVEEAWWDEKAQSTKKGITNIPVASLLRESTISETDAKPIKRALDHIISTGVASDHIEALSILAKDYLKAHAKTKADNPFQRGRGLVQTTPKSAPTGE